jgi:phosphatidylglycerol:prolipoprotein diacylglycerol transferase
MFPELLRIGPITVKTYGAFVAAGFIFALIYLLKRSGREGFSRGLVSDLSLYLLVSGIAGARALYVLLNWEFYSRNPAETFYVWSGGLVFYGGLIVAAATGIAYLTVKKLDVWRFADFVTPAVFLGMFFGRLGCFFAGCCYGKPCNFPWAVTFNSPISLAPQGIPLHPTQIYEALFCGAVFGVSHFLNGGRPFSKNFNGEVFFVSLIVYGLWRFLIEFVRGDDRGAMILGMYPSQFLSIFAIIVSVAAMIYLWQKKSGK